MHAIIAQKIEIGDVELTGPLRGPGGQSVNTIGDIIGIILTFLFPLAGVLLFVYLAWGGFVFLTSAGDPEKVKNGRAKITSALIGFILLVFSYFAVRIISYILGIGTELF